MIDKSPLEDNSGIVIAKSINTEAFSIYNQEKVDIESDINQLQRSKRDLRDQSVLIQDIHNILLYCKELSNQEKFELCTREKSHMKAYLKELLKKIS